MVVALRTSPPAGCTRMRGAVQGVTVMTIESLAIDAPQVLLTRNQYVVVIDGVTMIELPAPAEVVVTPGAPMNHSYVIVPPVAFAESVTLLPSMIESLSVTEEMKTAGHPFTVTMAV